MTVIASFVRYKISSRLIQASNSRGVASLKGKGSDDHFHLRGEVCDYMQDNKKHFEAFLVDDENYS